MEIEVIEPAEAETLENPGEGQAENEPETTAETPAAGESPADEVVVTIGDAEPPAEEQDKAPEWVRDLRKQHRELQKEKRELEQKLAAIQAPAPQATLGKKPTLEDHEYDADRYEAALTKWFEDKRKVDEVNAQREAEQQTQAQQWAKKLESYGEAKSKLKVQDFDEAEHTVMESMNQTQQGIILQGAENPALLVYALGKNPAKAKELAAIKDPVKYAFAIAKLETQLKVTPRKPPAPERTISGTGPVSGSSDSHLERLRAEAEKTGDMTKVIQYKRQLADKARG